MQFLPVEVLSGGGEVPRERVLAIKLYSVLSIVNNVFMLRPTTY